MTSNLEAEVKPVEIRCFGKLKKRADEKGWSFPYYYPLEKECSAIELLQLIGLPEDDIEGVFVDGLAKPLDAGWVKPGSRVGFIPYGVPGPYRVYLGIRKLD